MASDFYVGLIRMKRKLLAIFAVSIVALSLMSVLATGVLANGRQEVKDKKSETESDQHFKTSALAFHDDMRKLWEDHITWTRLVIVGVAANLPDLNATVERLLKNQEDLGNAVKAFYGAAAGNQLTTLLKSHIVIAAEILMAAKAGNATAVNDALNRWYLNADDIATFLTDANPKNWPIAETKAMMKEHLDLTLNEAVEYLSGNYTASIAAYELVHTQILGMADMLSTGIVRQFPSMFTGIGDIQRSEESFERNFEAHLTGRTWVSRVNSSVSYTIDTKAKGEAVFHESKDGMKIEFLLVVENIQNITMAHIHIDTGVIVGPIVVWLYPRQPPLMLIPGRFDGVLSKGTITAGDLTGPLSGKSVGDLVALMQKGETYVVVHTSQNPPGEIRGFIGG